MHSGKWLLKKVRPQAKSLQALSHPHRLAIVSLLLDNALWVRDLAGELQLPASLIQHHLKVLLVEGWVVKAREGKHSVYQLADKEKLKQILSVLG